TKSMVAGGGKIDEPGCFEYAPEPEPPDVEVSAFDAFVRHDYRVQILDVHLMCSPVGRRTACGSLDRRVRAGHSSPPRTASRAGYSWLATALPWLPTPDRRPASWTPV